MITSHDYKQSGIIPIKIYTLTKITISVWIRFRTSFDNIVKLIEIYYNQFYKTSIVSNIYNVCKNMSNVHHKIMKNDR